MSAPIPGARAEIIEALRVVGAVAASLSVPVSGHMQGGGATLAGWYTLTLDGFAVKPAIGAFSSTEALGWTVLAHWVERGGHPIERHMRRGGTTTTGWRVTLAGRTWSRTEATPADHARVAELAAALLVLRRWACPVRPWGLRDLLAEAVDKAQREASVLARPTRTTVIMSAIPASYLANYGTASE